MVISLEPQLEAALKELAQRKGVAPEELAASTLREHLLVPPPLEPRDEWERSLLGVAKNCGVSLPNWAVSSDGLYD